MLDDDFLTLLNRVKDLRAAGVTKFNGVIDRRDTTHTEFECLPPERSAVDDVPRFESPEAQALFKQAIMLESDHVNRQAENQSMEDLFGSSELGQSANNDDDEILL